MNNVNFEEADMGYLLEHLDSIELVSDPAHCAGTIRTKSGIVVAQVNGNPMSNQERNKVADEFVNRWNSLRKTP